MQIFKIFGFLKMTDVILFHVTSVQFDRGMQQYTPSTHLLQHAHTNVFFQDFPLICIPDAKHEDYWNTDDLYPLAEYSDNKNKHKESKNENSLTETSQAFGIITSLLSVCLLIARVDIHNGTHTCTSMHESRFNLHCLFHTVKKLTCRCTAKVMELKNKIIKN